MSALLSFSEHLVTYLSNDCVVCLWFGFALRLLTRYNNSEAVTEDRSL